MDSVIKQIMENELVWAPEKGVGYYPVKGNPYDEQYFSKYSGYEHTETGEKITKFRVDLVNQYCRGKVLDIGIGCGAFIKARGNAVGYDINPAATGWLRNNGLFFDPYNNEIDSEGVTFFDSLEHIRYPGILLQKIKGFVFISMPIFREGSHVIASRHFRKDEHYYYFTQDGLINFMRYYGFKCLEVNAGEIDCGREDIYSFVFKKE